MPLIYRLGYDANQQSSGDCFLLYELYPGYFLRIHLKNESSASNSKTNQPSRIMLNCIAYFKSFSNKVIGTRCSDIYIRFLTLLTFSFLSRNIGIGLAIRRYFANTEILYQHWDQESLYIGTIFFNLNSHHSYVVEMRDIFRELNVIIFLKLIEVLIYFNIS